MTRLELLLALFLTPLGILAGTFYGFLLLATFISWIGEGSQLRLRPITTTLMVVCSVLFATLTYTLVWPDLEKNIAAAPHRPR
jgi:hypothetical protein